MRKDCLIYDEGSGRMDIRFGLKEYYGGLHCGEGMEVILDGNWRRMRESITDIDNNDNVIYFFKNFLN